MYWAPRGGALPYITYTGMCRPTGRDFEAPGLERGIHTGTYPPEKYPSAPPPRDWASFYSEIYPKDSLLIIP